MPEYFPGDSYTTPDNIPTAAREYLMLRSRWSPYSLFFGIMFRYRQHALRGTYSDELWAKSSWETISSLERCGARFHISGLNRLRSVPGPVVIVGNHMSTLETLALPGLICPIKPVTYVVKEKLARGPIWGPIMKSRNPIVVTRKDARKDLEAVLTGGAERLARGISIIIFPQGTRREVFDRAEFNSLGVKLALKANVPVIPVALRTDFWGNSPVFRGFGPVHRDREIHLEFGEPIVAEGRGKAAHEKSLEFIESRLRAWGAAVRDPKPAP